MAALYAAHSHSSARAIQPQPDASCCSTCLPPLLAGSLAGFLAGCWLPFSPFCGPPHISILPRSPFLCTPLLGTTQSDGSKVLLFISFPLLLRHRSHPLPIRSPLDNAFLRKPVLQRTPLPRQRLGPSPGPGAQHTHISYPSISPAYLISTQLFCHTLCPKSQPDSSAHLPLSIASASTTSV